MLHIHGYQANFRLPKYVYRMSKNPPQWFKARNGFAPYQELAFVRSITLRNPPDIRTFTELHVIPESFFFFCPLERMSGTSGLC